MDKNSKARADRIYHGSHINRPKMADKSGFQKLITPSYKRPDAMLLSQFDNAKIHQMVTESVTKGPYIGHIKIIRIKRQLKAGEYVIMPAKIALFMLDDTQNIA